jgi:quinol monooxygenase YgiN
MSIAALPRPIFALFTSCTLLLAGCAISTPYPHVNLSEQRESHKPVILVITKIVINPQERQAFDRETAKVMRDMSKQPGLIGYSARRQLFGNEGWTISLWEDAAALDRFVRSDVHATAIEKSMSAVQTIDVKRMSMPLGSIPPDWPAALSLLAEPGNLRRYGW